VQQVFIPMKHVTERQMEASSYVLSYDLQGICENEIFYLLFSLYVCFSPFTLYNSQDLENHTEFCFSENSDRYETFVF